MKVLKNILSSEINVSMCFSESSVITRMVNSSVPGKTIYSTCEGDLLRALTVKTVPPPTPTPVPQALPAVTLVHHLQSRDDREGKMEQ